VGRRSNLKSVLIVTPTIGSPELKDCIESVMKQDYENVEYLLVVDGPEYEKQVSSIVGQIQCMVELRVLTLPYNTGGGGWYGHRIIAGLSHLINHDYVMFLDQDNMIEVNHVSSLVEKIESEDYDWVYSLRKIYSKDGEFICEDDSESLGMWPIAGNPDNGNLVDTSCYFFKRDFIRLTGYMWDSGWGGDRRYYQLITGVLNHKNFACSGKSTLLYRLGGNDGSVQGDMFLSLNKHMRDLYGNKQFPWRK